MERNTRGSCLTGGEGSALALVPPQSSTDAREAKGREPQRRAQDGREKAGSDAGVGLNILYFLTQLIRKIYLLLA